MEGSSVVRKGAWTKEEDNLLRECIHRYGEGKWHQIPSRAGISTKPWAFKISVNENRPLKRLEPKTN